MGLFCFIYKMFLLFGSGEKVTTLQPENRQEQDVIFYFKISAFARFQVMFKISAFPRFQIIFNRSASAITRRSCTNYMRPSLQHLLMRRRRSSLWQKVPWTLVHQAGKRIQKVSASPVIASSKCCRAKPSVALAAISNFTNITQRQKYYVSYGIMYFILLGRVGL